MSLDFGVHIIHGHLLHYTRVCSTQVQGQTLDTFTDISHIQTGFLVGHFVFTPTQKVPYNTFKETNHTDAFCFKLS